MRKVFPVTIRWCCAIFAIIASQPIALYCAEDTSHTNQQRNVTAAAEVEMSQSYRATFNISVARPARIAISSMVYQLVGVRSMNSSIGLVEAAQ